MTEAFSTLAAVRNQHGSRRTSRRRYGRATVAIAIALGIGPMAHADSLTFNLEPPAYTTGSINAQPNNMGANTWGGQDPNNATRTAINPALDQGVTNVGAHAGVQSFRMSSVVTSGSFGDQVFTPSLTDSAGEPGANGGVFAGGTLQPGFTATLFFKSVTGAPQDSHVAISADRGDGARMSWVQVSDNTAPPGDGRDGLSVSFYDYRVPANANDCLGGATQVDSEGKCFIFAVLAIDLDRSLWHRIDLEMEFYPGEANDVVRVAVDSGTPFRGTSWEDYFRNNQNPPFNTPPSVDSLLFRVGGGAEGNAGEGFLFDDIALNSVGCAAAARHVAPSGDDTFNDCRDSSAPCATIQHGIDVACAGDTVNVAAGTYVENVVVSQSVTVAGAGMAATTVLPAVSNPDCSGGSLCGGTASNGFLVQADNVTIHDLTVDGDNPSLTSGVVRGGADIDATNGIITNHLVGTFNNLEVHHVAVKNIFLRGMYASSGGSFDFHDNTISNVQGSPSSIAMFNWVGAGTMASNTVTAANDAISSNHSSGVQFLDNVVTNSGSGVHTDNAGDGGGVADLIQGNQISNCSPGGFGIFTFVPYIAPTVTGNTVTNCDVGLTASGGGPAVVFSNNTVDGMHKPNSVGVYVTTSQFGYASGDVSASFTGNVVINTSQGFFLQDKTCSVSSTQSCTTDGDCPSGESCLVGSTLTVSASCNQLSGNDTGIQADALSTPANAVFNNNSIAGNTVGANGVAIPSGNLDAQNNWWGCINGPGAAGCDPVLGNVDVTPVAASIPACVNCTADSDCNAGHACVGPTTPAETCNLGTHMCQAQPPCGLGPADGQCNDPVCAEPAGCALQARTDGTACNVGDLCQSGLCTGAGSLIVTRAYLRTNTTPTNTNGTVRVTAFVNDNDTGGGLVGDLVAGAVTLDVKDNNSFQITTVLTGCKAGRYRGVTCRSADRKVHVTVRRALRPPGPNLYTVQFRQSGLGTPQTGYVLPSGPVTVTLTQAGITLPHSTVLRAGDISSCKPRGRTSLSCRTP